MSFTINVYWNFFNRIRSLERMVALIAVGYPVVALIAVGYPVGALIAVGYPIC